MADRSLDPGMDISALKEQLAQREAEYRHAEKIQAALYEIADAASAATDMQEFYAALHRIVGKLMYAKNFYVTLYDPATHAISAPYFADEAGDTAPPTTRLDTSNKSLRGIVLLTGKTLHLSAEEIEEGRLRGRFTPMGTPAEDWIGVPLKMDGQVIGSLTVQSYEKGMRYEEQDVRLLEFVAQHIAVALTRARAIEETRQRNAELKIINSVQEGLASKLDLQDIYEVVGDKVREIFRNMDMSIRIYDAMTNLIHYPYTYENGQRITIHSFPLPERGFGPHVLRTRESLVINENMPQAIEKYGSGIVPGTLRSKSLVMVPLVAGNQARGLITLNDMEHEHTFKESDVHLLQTLANSMSVALENARLFDETQRLFQAELRAHEQAETLRSVAQALNRSLSLTEVFNLVLTEIQKVIPYDSAGIYQVHENRRVLVAGSGFTNLGELIGVSFEFNQQDDEIGYVISRSLEPLILEDAPETYPQYFSAGLHAATKIRSYMAVPIVLNQKLIGMITLDREQPGFYKDQHASLAMAFAAQAATAINNARLFDETQRLLKETEQRNAELQIINRIQVGLVSKLDVNAIYELVGEELRRIFPQFDVGLALYDPETDIETIPYAIERGKRVFIKPYKVNGLGFDAQMIREHKTILINEKYAEAMEKAGDYIHLEMPKSALMVPLIVRDTLRGNLEMEDMDHEHAFSNSDVRLLETLANSMSIALENARLFDEIQKRNQEITEALEQQTATSEILSVIASSPTDVQPVFDAMIERAVKLCNGHSGFVTQVIDNQIHFAAGHNYIDPRSPQEIINYYPIPLDTPEDKSNMASVIRNRTVLHVADLKTDPRVTQSNRDGAVRWGVGTTLWVPLVKDEKGIGAIVIAKPDVDPFTEKQIALIKTFADQAVIAIENVRLFNELQKRNQEITETLEQQTATSEILSVIASSPTDVQPVFDTIVEHAAKLCGGISAYAFRVMDEKIYPVTGYYTLFDNMPQDQELLNSFPVPMDGPEGESNIAPIIRNRAIFHVADMQTDPRITPDNRDFAKRWGIGAAIWIPLVKDEKGIGAIYVDKIEAKPFTDKQIALVKTFADQAVIAIENVRLFNELQKRNQEITEALEQQTATSEILSVIANSPTDVQPVFDAIIERATVLCGGATGIAYRVMDDQIYVAAQYRFNPQAFQEVLSGFPIPLTDTESNVASVIRSRTILHITDMKSDPRLVQWNRDMAVKYGAGSTLWIPLVKDETGIGAIFIGKYKTEPFTEQQIALVKTFADQAVIAIENVRLFTETQRLLKETEDRAAELAIINSVQQGLASQLDIQAIFDLVGEKVSEIFRVNEVCISTYDRETKLEHFPYIVQKGRRLSQDPIPHDEKGFIPLVMRTRQPIMINEHLAERAVEIGSYLLGEAEMPLSAIYVPLVIGEEARGVIVIASDREQAFTDSDLRLLNTLANSMSVALENARLFNETQQRNAELAIINSVQEGLASKLDMQAIYDLVGDKIREIFDAQAIQLVSFDHEKNLMYRNYLIEKGQRLYVDPLPISKVWAYFISNRRTFLINNVKDFIDQIDPGFAPPVGHAPKSVIAVPLMVKDEIRGAIDLENLDRENSFSDSDVRLLQTLANAMSIALENARLFDETQQRNAELAIINSVQEGLASKLDMQEIYELVGEKLRGVFQDADLSIGVYDPEADLLSAPFVVERGSRVPFPTLKLNGRGIIGYMLRDPKPLLFNENMEQAVRQYQSTDVTGGGIPKSALYVPLMMSGSMRGVVVLEDLQKEHAFTESDVRLLDTLADSMSVALENARLWEQEKLYRKALEREFEIGREIQAGFLPDTLPQPKGWEIAASLKSAREVAGDFYDVFELPEERIGLVIGDVCDKGLGAALFMTLFRSLIRAVSNLEFFARAEQGDGNSSAARLKNAISLTNNYIAETHGKTGMFATVFFGILDTRSGVLTYVNGGHLPPVLVNKLGVKETLRLTGSAVGAIPDTNYAVGEVLMERGDSFFAYTDGLTDSANPSGEFFSPKELIPSLVEKQPLARLLEQFQKCIEEHVAGGKQFDDITMLALRRLRTRSK